MNPCFPPFLIPGEPSTIAFILRMDKSAKKRTSKIRNSKAEIESGPDHCHLENQKWQCD